MIKMIAIDLDGTLLDTKKKISTRNKVALAKAKAQGVKIVLCTGRPLRAIRPYLDELQLKESGDYSITFNGGLVQKNDTGEVMAKSTLSYANVKELVELAQRLGLPLDVVSDEVVYILPTDPQHESIYAQLNPLLHFQLFTVAELTEDLLYNKAVVAFEQTYLDQQLAKIPADFKERYEIIKTRDVLLEFMPKGVTKAYGCQLLAEHLGITADEVMAIGDEENDLPMIEYAGLGVAMENAVPMVKAAADVVTASNTNDGVAQVVEKYVLQ
ncbi:MULTISPECIES: Cof-type HAD-IIB family hydrolase [Enterococcus]|uniref:HAD superfamily hydrolase n=1 Tax=Enterococcus dispar ATCC 51266 TaxID=1139219 RepID=S1NAN5_9ENTE|nr:Cof-type HAD-IIB family hydrolase [Enterococcus dispar]EOT38964.1 HAD superfamily hydrolase [Enterococcus dispar ATCC 51266]EOW86135.1 HAD superfamily hydrolase [Enterococcus dispar ATCC 51266]WCG32400.1 Cof-type HAD-IIB family hydrolase [Enterococcus dispar]